MQLTTILGIHLRTELREFVAVHQQNIGVDGVTTPRDQALEMWYYDENSMDIDNGTTVLKPNDILVTEPGRYLRWKIQVDWNTISNKPTFAPVSTSGSYNDLSSKPTIPSGTVTSIGLSSSDLTVSGTPITASGTITANLTNTGVTAGVYGLITVDAKGRVTGGKRQETYSGSTNSSGVYTVTFSTAYSVAPNIQANIIGGSNTNLIKITSVSTTGFTVTVVNRVDVLGLLPTYSNVNGASVDVLINEK